MELGTGRKGDGDEDEGGRGRVERFTREPQDGNKSQDEKDMNKRREARDKATDEKDTEPECGRTRRLLCFFDLS